MHTSAALSSSLELPMSIATVDLADPGPGEVLVRVVAAGICHTDLVTRSFWPADRSPMVFGHEGAGVVEAVGAGVDHVDQVVMSFRSCGACTACREGHPAYCDMFVLLNASGGRADGSSPLSLDGVPVYGSFFGQSSFATHAISHADNTVVVDPDVDLSVAAPFGCSVQTGAGTVLNVLKPERGTWVVVYGAGGVGLAAVMAAVALGAEVVVVDPIPERRALAIELGARAAIDPSAAAISDAVVDATLGGANHTLDTTALPDVINSAVRALAPCGGLALVGLGAPEVTLTVADLMSKGRSIMGVIEGDARPHKTLPALLSMHRDGVLPVEKLIRSYEFADINTAFADAAAGRVIKPVLRLSGQS
jgi:aryl-alcohol dehydrogenase